MTTGRQENLRRRYTSLGLGELTSAAAFAALAASGVLPVISSRSDAAALWSALAPLLAILVQAGVYWLMARSWVGRRPMPGRVAAVYRALRLGNPLLLAAGLVGAVGWLPGGAGAVLVVVVWLFGVVEYLNYFVVSLSYPVNRWPSLVRQWRTPRLVEDLRTAELTT